MYQLTCGNAEWRSTKWRVSQSYLAQQIESCETSPIFQLVVASVSNINALSFGDKSSATFKLVVASVTNKFSTGPTNDSPAKQHLVPNDDSATESSLQHIYLAWGLQQISVLLPDYERFNYNFCLHNFNYDCDIDPELFNPNNNLAALQLWCPSKSESSTQANFRLQFIVASKRRVLNAHHILDDAAHLFQFLREPKTFIQPLSAKNLSSWSMHLNAVEVQASTNCHVPINRYLNC